jgi:hypothetical protein
MSGKCVFVEGCPMYNHLTTAIRIILLQPYVKDYCLSGDNYQNCARFKIKSQGTEAPDDLLPDGARLKA